MLNELLSLTALMPSDLLLNESAMARTIALQLLEITSGATLSHTRARSGNFIHHHEPLYLSVNHHLMLDQLLALIPIMPSDLLLPDLLSSLRGLQTTLTKDGGLLKIP